MPYEWQQLWDAMDPEPEPVYSEKLNGNTAHLAGSRFNELADFGHILSRLAKCQLVRSDAIAEHWHYPNSENDISVTRYLEDDHATIWSETMASELGLEVRRPYDKFGFWATLKHGGNFGAAHSELVNVGIGDNLYKPSGLSPKDVLREPLILPSGLIVVRAGEVERREVEWLWPGWAPLRKLATCDGDPGTGKSTMLLDIAARTTTGQPMPDQAAPTIGKAAVILLSGEDDLDDTIIWRLAAAGADLNRVHHVQAAISETGSIPVTIPRDLGLLETLINQTGAALVIIDVLNEYLDSKVDNYRDTDIRRALHQVREIANRTNSSIVMLRHLRKEGGKAIYRGGGSIGIVGAARAGWAVAHHPEEESMRILASVKMNLAIRPAPLGFKLIPADGMSVARVDWRGAIEGMSAELLLGDQTNSGNPDEIAEKRSKLKDCMDAIREVLKDGPVWSNELFDAIVKGGIASSSTFDRARAKLALVTTRERTPNGLMGWRVDLSREE